jgi:glucose-6-phosphate isomerase
MENIPFDVSLDLALTGEGAPPQAHYEEALGLASGSLAWLRDAYAERSLELLGLPARTDDLDTARPVAEKFLKDTTGIVVYGIGGSSLGARALAALRPANAKGPRLSVIDNPDPFSLTADLARFDLKTTRFVSVSKSGSTAETLLQTLVTAEALERAGLVLRDHFVAITEPKPSVMRKFAEDIGAPILDHPMGVGGRYAVLTLVGMFPAMLMGLDVNAIRAGAGSVVASAVSGAFADKIAPASGAALHFALARADRLRETVLWSYADKLGVFGAWWRQLWAESLGKDGQGSTPVAALGPVDQHSQLQLFRDGPGGALFTLLSIDTKGQGPAVPPARANALGLSYVAGKTAGDLVAAEVRATAETLHGNGRPVRRIHVPKIDEYSMGALMMHFMLETILMGRLMQVDPFDQPGVEEGKVLARKYLAEG